LYHSPLGLRVIKIDREDYPEGDGVEEGKAHPDRAVERCPDKYKPVKAHIRQSRPDSGHIRQSRPDWEYI